MFTVSRHFQCFIPLHVPGGHTGAIQSMGGSGDASGGSGSGGRITVYHTSNVTHDFFQGAYNVHGGPVYSSAEAGASGTFYLKNLGTELSVLRVDNDGRQSIDNEVENLHFGFTHTCRPCRPMCVSTVYSELSGVL